MRRLGTELGVEAMSLYRYVAGRDDLLEGMVDQMVEQLHLDPSGGRPGPDDGWQAYLQWLAHGVRQLVQEHPHAFPLIATRHPAAPWLRPPLRSLGVVEDFLTTLVARGFTDDGAVAAYRAFSSFLLGHLLLEAAMLGSRTAPAVDLEDEGASGAATSRHGRPAGLPGPATAGGPPVRGPRGRGVRAGAGGPAGPARARPARLEGTTGPAQSAMCRR